MKNFNWKNNNLTHLHVELTNHCNAACPFCPRHVGSSAKVRPDLVLESISIENFKTWFPKNLILDLTNILFCGTHGDPSMCKDILPIIEYITLVNPNCSIMINTNGGIRNLNFWKELGNLLKHNQDNSITFSIDGLEDTNHLYRRNVTWTKLIENVKAYNNTGATAIWDFLIFRHNEHQIEQARKLAKELKFSEIKFKRALGFEYKSNGVVPREVYDKYGNLEYIIESPMNTDLVNSKIPDRIQRNIKQHVDLSYVDSNKPGYNKYVEYSIETFNPKNNQNENSKTIEQFEITCKSCRGNKKTSEIYVSANGVVFPCCYVGTSVDSDNKDYESTQTRIAMRQFGLKYFDLTQTSLYEIISNGYLDAVFSNSWDKQKFTDGKLAKCASTCGIQSNIDNIYI